MKTSIYAQCLKKINLFCNLSKKGFIVAEINDLITKDELITDLRQDKLVTVFDLDMLSDRVGRTSEVDFLGDILIIDEVASPNVEKVVVNLNYNRDWFLKLNKIIVIVLPTVIVNRLIEYSYSFWSFVYLHVLFNSKFPPFINPQFISEYISYDTAADVTTSSKIKKNVFGTSKSAISVVLNYYGKIFAGNNGDLNRLLLDIFSQVDFTNTDSIEEGFESIFSLGEAFIRNENFKEALKCFYFLDQHFNISENCERIDFELKRNIVYANYREGNYLSAFDEVSKVLSTLPDDGQVTQRYGFLSAYELASLWNNAGVLLYMIGDPIKARSLFTTAAEIINDSPITFHIGEVLFNLSLVSILCDDNRNAIYYIDNAIECLESFSGRSVNVLQSRYNVLKAYILVNMGAVYQARMLIKPSLNYLRCELFENHEYIMDAHFVFALIYLHNKELQKASNCGQKAIMIAKKIRIPLRERARIYQLLGEINYYLGNFYEARRFLYHASRQKAAFSDEVGAWILLTMEECDRKLNVTDHSNKNSNDD